MEDLVESILDYVRADYTDYAIMINGEWGSGKTYFWNHKVKNKISNLVLPSNFRAHTAASQPSHNCRTDITSNPLYRNTFG